MTIRTMGLWCVGITLTSIAVSHHAQADYPSRSVAHELVAHTAIKRLVPTGARAIYLPNLEKIVEIAAQRPTGEPGSYLPADAHYLMLDVDARSTAAHDRLQAVMAFPHVRAKAEELFDQHNQPEGGSLPWSMQEQFNLLVAALRANDQARIIRSAASVIQLATDAALPFSTTVTVQGPPGSKIRWPSSPDSTETDPRQTARGRIQTWIIERDRSSIDAQLSSSSCSARLTTSVVEAALTVMMNSAAALDAVLLVDTELISRWRVADRSTFLAIQQTYGAELADRCGPILTSRLSEGACLAAALLTRAVQVSRAGSDPAIVTSNLKQQDPSLMGSKNSKKFHLTTCRHAKTIKLENVVTFGSSREAIRAGRQPCAVCRPLKNAPP